MTKDELYSKIVAMLPIENTDCKPFRMLYQIAEALYEPFFRIWHIFWRIRIRNKIILYNVC